MLDTDISSYVIKGSSPSLDAKLRQVDPTQICISAVTRAELKFGLRHAGSGSARLTARISAFLARVETVPWDEAAADEFAEVRVWLERAGTPIGIMDTMIAAHAKSLRLKLITDNLKHFRMVRGLQMENWQAVPALH